MGCSQSAAIPARVAVPTGHTRICVIGFSMSHNVGRAAKLANAIASAHPDKYETWFYFGKFREQGGLLETVKAELTADDQKNFAEHKTAPFCWLETDDGGRQGIGGRDRLCEWAAAEFPDDSAVLALANTPPSKKPWKGDLFPSSTKPTC